MTGTTKFLLGLTAGTVVALLVAPKKGEELRNDISDRATKLKNQLGKLIGRSNGKLEDFKTYINKHVDELSDDVKRKIIELIDKSDLSENAKKRFTEAIPY
ncbi:MAG: YtxH domain-containing protein [Bacteroidetes bacterium]|nr:YtxH domain-containing protein [Bacteroidota bacterium]